MYRFHRQAVSPHHHHCLHWLPVLRLQTHLQSHWAHLPQPEHRPSVSCSIRTYILIDIQENAHLHVSFYYS